MLRHVEQAGGHGAPVQELGAKAGIMCARYEHIVEPVELSRLLRDLARKNIAVEARAALVAPPRSRVAGCRLEPFREAARLQVGAPLTKQEALRSLLLLVVGEKLLREGANLRVGGTTRREACRLCLVNVHGFSDQPRSPRWSRAAPRTVTPPFLRVAPCHTRSSSSPRFPRIVRDPPPFKGALSDPASPTRCTVSCEVTGGYRLGQPPVTTRLPPPKPRSCAASIVWQL